MKKGIWCHIVSVLLILFISSCSGKTAIRPAERFDPEKAFAKANAQLDKNDYDQARAGFLEVKNRDMSKKFAPLAQLKIADSYVKQGEPELAVAEYQKFMDAYPDNDYDSYAQYQIAMVYFNQIEGPERGYSGAEKALAEFEKLKKLYPRNPYRDTVDLKIEKCRNTIAEYEQLVGAFYYKKGSYHAAIGRFVGLLKKYPDYKGEADVLYYTGMSYKNLGEKEKAKEYFSRLIEKYPSNKIVKTAKKELADLRPR